VPGMVEDAPPSMVNVEPGAAPPVDDVANRDVLDSEFNEVDDVLAYELAVVVDGVPLPVVSTYLDVWRFFSSVFCNTSILSCRSFTSIFDSFSCKN